MPKSNQTSTNSESGSKIIPAVLGIIIVGTIILLIIHFTTKSTDSSVEPSLQLELVTPQLRAGAVDKLKPKKSSMVWNEGKPLTDDEEPSFYDLMSSINY
jgi:hypothetical protein